LAISSNFGDFFNWYRVWNDINNPIVPGNGTNPNPNPFKPSKSLDAWTNDFSKIIVGSIFIYTYVFILPTILWVFAKYKNISISLIQSISIYGYSCFLYLPSVLLMTINYDYLRWIFIFISFIYSSVFLCLNTGWEFQEELKGREKLLIIGVLLYMIFIQGIFSLFLKFYFFNFSH
jgi:protein YIPF1/2